MGRRSYPLDAITTSTKDKRMTNLLYTFEREVDILDKTLSLTSIPAERSFKDVISGQSLFTTFNNLLKGLSDAE